MSELEANFVAAMGRPAPQAPPGLPFETTAAQIVWEAVYTATGAGFFRDRFLYLFGAGLQSLRPCLKAWSFLVPPLARAGMIVGRNAYGGLLVLENPEDPGPASRVKILDPISVTYGADPDIDLVGLAGYWLAKQKLYEFLDDDIYRSWREREHRYLGADEMLGIKVPPGLGGELELENFQVEKIIRYYQTTGPIYAKAFAKAQKRAKGTDGKGKTPKAKSKAKRNATRKTTKGKR